MFALLGAIVLFYTVIAITRAKVYARFGWRGQTVSSVESLKYFWVVIVIYAALGIVLLTVF